MDTTATSMMATTKEWEWTACEACGGMDEEQLSDRLASLVGGEVERLYEEMRDAFNIAFDECYPDPNQDNEEEYFDRHVEWVDWYENAMWNEEFGNPGVVRLVRDGDRYTLTARDTEGNQGNERRTIDLDPALSYKEIREQVWEFLRAQDPRGKMESICFSHVEELLEEEARASRTAGH